MRPAPPPTPPAGGRGAIGDSAGVDPDVFATSAWYDDKGPRKIRLNYVTRGRLGQLWAGGAIAAVGLIVLSFWLWPLLLLLLFALVSGPKLRAQLRAAGTRWLDTLDQAA